MEIHLSEIHPHTQGPRPRVKATLLVDGIPVRICESLEEMNVRLSHMRKRRDYRSADRILAASDDTRARARKSFRRNEPMGD